MILLCISYLGMVIASTFIANSSIGGKYVSEESCMLFITLLFIFLLTTLTL